MKSLLIMFAVLAAAIYSGSARATARLHMTLAQPAAVQSGQPATVRVFTYTGARCTLNDRSPRANSEAGWLSWTFRAGRPGTAAVQVRCSRGFQHTAEVRYLTVHPARPGWRTVATYSGSGGWQSPVMRIPAAPYRIAYRYTCEGPASAFLAVRLVEGHVPSESFWRQGEAESGTWTGTRPGATGYWEIGTQDSCSWSVSIITR
jgi:hypothetical protein